MCNLHRKNSGKVTLIIMIVLLLGCLFMMVVLEPPRPLKLSPEQEAEFALRGYLEAAWNYKQGQGEKMGAKLKEYVLREDWMWYESNYEHIFNKKFDTGGVLKLAEDHVKDTAGKPEKMYIAMRKIVINGANRPDCEILETKKLSEDAIEFKIKQLESGEYYSEHTVRLKRVGVKWRMIGFAGGRERVTRSL